MAETPREPDRFEAKARELVDMFVATGTHVTEMRASLAAALRAERRDALESAMRVLDGDAQDPISRDAARWLIIMRERIRALIPSPEAPPAKEEARIDARDVYGWGNDGAGGSYPPAADVSALLGRGHVENPREGEPGDAETYSEPAAPAAERDLFAARLATQLVYARARIAELEAAIRWALGEEGEFPSRQPGEGAFRWRTELRRRAALAGEQTREVP